MSEDAFADAVTRIVAQLDPGEVVAYGEVAAEAGYPGAARAVGNLLRRTPGLPWWRVVTATGRLVPGIEAEQAELLRAEGIPVRNGRVVARRGHRKRPGARSRRTAGGEGGTA